MSLKKCGCVGCKTIKMEKWQGTIKKGDTLRFIGHTTDFVDQVTSMEVNNQPVEEATAGDFIGLKVKERVRENDRVCKVVE